MNKGKPMGSANQDDLTTKKPAAASRITMPAVVLGLLGGHVVFVLLAITLATGDRSFAVVPDYYQKAVAFDDRKAALAASEALGWSIELEPARTMDLYGTRDIVLQLHDGGGQAVAGASVTMSCYHLARADEPVEFDLVEVLPGQYVGQAALGREGFWWFELQAQQGDEQFVAEFKQFVWAGEVAR